MTTPVRVVSNKPLYNKIIVNTLIKDALYPRELEFIRIPEKFPTFQECQTFLKTFTALCRPSAKNTQMRENLLYERKENLLPLGEFQFSRVRVSIFAFLEFFNSFNSWGPGKENSKRDAGKAFLKSGARKLKKLLLYFL